MSTDVLQPSLQRRTKDFGGRNLVLSKPWQITAILQAPELEWPTAGWAGKIFFSYNAAGNAGTTPALVEIGRDWVGLVLKPRSPRPQPASIFDMAPLDLGRVLREPSEDDDLLEEMLDDTRF
jgi:hypothetical protein